MIGRSLAIVFFILQVFASSGIAQYIVPAAGDTSYHVTFGTITDHKGDEDHHPFPKGSATIFPATPGYLRLTFNSFDPGNACGITIYNDSASNNFLGSFNGYKVPTTIYSYIPNAPLKIVSSQAFFGRTGSGFNATIDVVNAVPAPDLAINKIFVSSGMNSGSSIWAGAELKNIEGARTGYDVSLYLSRDTLFSADDIFLDSIHRTNHQLSGGDQTYVNIQAEIPAAIGSGNFYLLGIAEAHHVLQEQNTGNNLSWLKFYLEQGKTDLFPGSYNVYSPNSLSVGRSYYRHIGVGNYGNMHLQEVDVNVFISDDHSLDSSDLLLSGILAENLNSNAIASVNHSFIIPTSIQPGDHYLIYHIDPLNKIQEYDETNNFQFVKVKIIENAPAIHPVSLNRSTVMRLGIPFQIYATAQCVRNGSEPVVSNNELFYSKDPILDSSDLLITQKSSSLNSVTTDTIQFTIANVDTGRCYLLYNFNADNALMEKDLSDNVLVFPAYLQNSGMPDYRVYSIRDVMPCTAGINFSASVIIDNIGSAASSGAIEYKVIMSYDSVHDATDSVIYHSFIDPPGIANSKKIQTSVFIPSNTPSTLYLFHLFDENNLVIEGDETNNVFRSTLKVKPASTDLFVSFYNGHDTLRPSSINNIVLSASVNNTGNLKVNAFHAGLYISEDPEFDSLDYKWSEILIDSLMPFQGKMIQFDSLPDPQLSLGSYFIMIKADINHVITEADEMNVALAPVFIGETSQIPVIKMPHTGTTTFSGCNAYIYDDGLNGNYSNSSAGTMHLFTGSKYPLLRFKEYAFAQPVDHLSVYDGSSVSSSLIGSFNFHPGEIHGTTQNGLLLKMESDNSTTRNGFKIHLGCVTDPDPDIILRSMQDADYFPGISAGLQFEYSNIAEIYVPRTEVRLLLSDDSIPDAGDHVLFDHQLLNMGAFGYAAYQRSFTIPPTLLPGLYYLIHLIDPHNKLHEKNESNNVYVKKIDVVEKVTEVVFETVYTHTNGTMLLYQLMHTGIVPDSINVAAYISEDPFLDSDDSLFIDTLLINTLQGEISLTTSGNAGSVFLILVADPLNRIQELMEDNNIWTELVTLKPNVPTAPDYMMYDVVIQKKVFHVGEHVSVSFILGDPSNTLPATEVKYFLSMDSLYNPGDYLLGSTTGQGQTYFNIALPYFITPGTYYVIIYVDPSNLVTEANELNNTHAIQVKVVVPKYDFQIKHVSSQSSIVTPGSWLTLTYYQSDEWNEFATPYLTSNVFLSKDSLRDSTDISISSFAVNHSLGIGSRSAYIPASIDTGEYFLIYYVDEPESYSEINEANNTSLTKIHVTNTSDDHYITEFSITSFTASPGEQLKFKYTLANLLDIDTNDSTAFYLSSDTILDQTDQLIGKSIVYINGWSGGSSYTPVILPSSTAIGLHYIIAKADANEHYIETNELNNIAWTPLQVSAASYDIKLVSISPYDYYFVNGEAITSQVHLLNSGTSSVTFQSGFYISADTIFDSSDVLISSESANLKPGEEIYYTQSGQVPLMLDTGIYYLLVKSDHTDLYAESSELNNMLRQIIFIQRSVRDIVCEGNGYAGFNQYYNYSFTNINKGNIDVPFTTTMLYFSMDTVPDQTDSLLNSYQVAALAPGATAFNHGTFDISLVSSSYGYLLFCGDAQDVFQENNEVNNVSYIQITRTHLLPEIGTTSNSGFVPDTVVIGDSMRLDCTVFGNCYGGPYSTHLGVYFSDDELFDMSDQLVTERTFSEADNLYWHTFDSLISVPLSLTTGLYKVFFIADNRNELTEFSEINNISSFYLWVNGTISIKEHQNKGELLLIYPNPTADIINIRYNGPLMNEGCVVNVNDQLGAVCMSVTLYPDGNGILSCTSLAPGVYYLSMLINDQVIKRKFVKL